MSDPVISFCAQGHINQRVKIIKPGLTADALCELLKKGEAVTTITIHNHPIFVEMLETGERLAQITNTENNLEYSDFDVVNQ